MRYKIMVVDDENDNRKFLKSALEAHGLSVALAEEGSEALIAAEESQPDLILADVAMPGLNGLKLCERLKSNPRTARIPVILMSGAFKDDPSQSDGLDIGADDYLIKPFTPRLMMSRINGVLRRYAAPAEVRDVLTSGGLSIDLQARTVRNKKEPVPLTRKEFDLLTTLIRKRGRVLGHLFLLETVWGYDPAVYNDPHTVETHICSLRRKLGPKLAKLIANVPGIGYRFDG